MLGASIIFILGMIHYGWWTRMHESLRRRESDPGLRLSQDEWWSGRASTGEVARSMQRRWVEPSDDPEIEHARRAMQAAFGLGAVLVVVGFPIGMTLERVVRSLALASPGFAIALIVDLAIGCYWLVVGLDAIVGPVRYRRKAIASALGLVGCAIAGVVVVAAASS